MLICTILLIPSTAYAATRQPTATSESDSIITPQSYTITYQKSISRFYTDFSSIPETYFYTEYYKDFGWASGNLLLESVKAVPGGYSVIYSGTMYCITN